MIKTIQVTLMAPANLIQRLSLLLIGIVSLATISEAVTYQACETSSRVQTGPHPGDSGRIVVKPKDVRQSCKLEVYSCTHCRLLITAVTLTFKPCVKEFAHVDHFQSLCVHDCSDYITLHEPAYPSTNYRYIYFGAPTTTYISLTSDVYMDICLGPGAEFTLEYTVLEKVEYHNSTSGDMSITSPRFPIGYLGSGDIYRYVITAPDITHRVRLWFTDWNLFKKSKIKIYDDKTTVNNILLDPIGEYEGTSNARPFIQSESNKLIVEFDTGTKEAHDRMLYLGFRAQYSFARSSFWRGRPYAYECGDYFGVTSWGGDFQFDGALCPQNKVVDCVWVINKHASYSDYVWLQITDVHSGDNSATITIRSGNNSQGSDLGVDVNRVTAGETFIESSAFYVHVRMTCLTGNIFKATFASYDNAEKDGYEYRCPYHQHQKCDNNRCIAKWLFCDQKNHCEDWSDEGQSHCYKDCQPQYPCADGVNSYCAVEQCDNKKDCPDGSDEHDCFRIPTSTPPQYDSPSHYYWGTITPVILICLILAIITCVVISYYVRRKRLLRERSRNMNHTRTEIVADDEDSHFLESPRHPQAALRQSGSPPVDGMLPPSYEETMRASYVHSMGNVNIAFDSYPLDMPTLPPPYSPKHDTDSETGGENTAQGSQSAIQGSQSAIQGSQSAQVNNLQNTRPGCVPSIHHPPDINTAQQSAFTQPNPQCTNQIPPQSSDQSQTVAAQSSLPLADSVSSNAKLPNIGLVGQAALTSIPSSEQASANQHADASPGAETSSRRPPRPPPSYRDTAPPMVIREEPQDVFV